MKEKSTPQKSENPRYTRHQNLLFFGTAAVVVLVLLVVSIRSVAFGYFNSFVLRDETVSTATSYFTGLTPTEEEQSLLAPFQEDWDSYRNARLADTVTVTTADGVSLSGTLYWEGGSVTVVYLHHYDGSSEDDFLLGGWLGEQGCNLLLSDSRNHGESGGEYCGFGALEAADLLCWLDWIRDNLGDQKIILYGDGMGAVTALLAAAQGLPDEVCFLVAESPYSSLDDIASHLLMQAYQVPMFPVYNVMEWRLSSSGAGYSAKDVDAVKAAAQAKVPALFLMGTEDTHVPPEQTQEVYDAYAGKKALISQPVSHGVIQAQAWDEILNYLSPLLDS